MKKIFIYLLFITGLSAFCTNVKAQSSEIPTVSIGPEFGIPFNTASDNAVTRIYNAGFGASAKLDIPLSTPLHLTVTAGFITYTSPATLIAHNALGENYNVGVGPFSYVPVKAGLRYYYKTWYAEGGAGLAVAANSNSTTSFIYTGGAGTLLPLTRYSSIDLGIRFERGYKNTDFSYPMGEVAIRAAYNFDL
jgi:hypothetical protein